MQYTYFRSLHSLRHMLNTGSDSFTNIAFLDSVLTALSLILPVLLNKADKLLQMRLFLSYSN